MLIPNKCFSCNQSVQEDNYLRQRFVCSNQRCIRFGLVSAVYIAPPANAGDTTPPTTKEILTEVAEELENNAQEPKSDDPNLPPA